MARSDRRIGVLCRRFRRDLPLFPTGDLPPERARKIERHIRRCRACRREVDAWRRQADSLRALRRDPADAPLSPLFWKGVRKEIAEDPAPIDRLRVRRKRLTWMAAAAALLVGVALTFALVGLFGGAAGPEPGGAPDEIVEPFEEELPPPGSEPELIYAAKPEVSM